MSNEASVPVTLSGIKRRAKTIKHERAIPHHAALDLAATEAGYQNIRHAQNHLSNLATPHHACYLTAYWSKPGSKGRETLTIGLPLPLRDIVARHQLSFARTLHSFRLESEDHLERRVDVESQERAHDVLFAAVRTLRFMAATGLKPATTLKQRNFLANEFHSLPGRDHTSEWLDVTGAWVFCDEPYSERDLQQRQEWANSRGYVMATPSWEGFHAPGSSIPYIFCEDSELSVRLTLQLNALRKGLSVPLWDGVSAPYTSPFISPARGVSGKPRAPRPMPAYRGYAIAGALPYGALRGGEKSSWRPEQRMALKSHLTVGPLLYALDNFHLPQRQRNAVAYLRTTLDDWLMMEYPTEQEMTSEQFRQAYYGEHREPIIERKKQIEAVQKIMKSLDSGYAPCKPKTKLLKVLADMDTALRSKRWASPERSSSSEELFYDRHKIISEMETAKGTHFSPSRRRASYIFFWKRCRW